MSFRMNHGSKASWPGSRIGALLFMSMVIAACSKSNTKSLGGGPDSSLGDGGAPDGTADAYSDSSAADGNDAAPRRCIENVGQSPSTSVAMPLQKPHGELWRKTIGLGSFSKEIVISDQRLAIVIANSLHVLSRAGESLWKATDFESFATASPPLADSAGNLYFVGKSVFAFAPDGATRWKYPLGPNSDLHSETTYARRLLLSQDGGLYLASSDGFLYAFNAADGTLRWQRNVGLSALGQALRVDVGIGDTLFVSTIPFMASNGTPSGQPFVDGRLVRVSGADYGGMIGASVESNSGAYSFRSYYLDFCMNPLWAVPADNPGDQWEVFLSLPEELFAVCHYPPGETVGGKVDGYIFSSDGKPLLGPKSVRGVFTAAGADGSIYAIECSSSDSDANLTLCAYSSNLDERWCISLGTGCSQHAGALADDGVMYLVRSIAGNANELIAVQTESPGLALSGMPTPFFSNRRTGWLGSP